MDVLEELVRLRRSGERCALATIVEVNGSIPSFESAKMLIRADGTIVGTIGGGCVEADVWSAAQEVMSSGKPRRMRFNLSQDAAYDEGLICGGQLEVFIEPVEPRNRALIFGAGHISKSIARLTSMIGFHTTVIDNRESFANRERFPEADEVVAREYEDLFPSLDVSTSTYIVIVTRGHRDDMRVLRWAVTTPARYIAMIGSKRKVINVVKELEKEGVPRASFDRVYGPMGLDIGALTPEEIAVSVAAEIVAVRRGAGSNWRALSMSVFAHEETRALLP
jgi:xanthine dehydrogenase accessory factor